MNPDEKLLEICESEECIIIGYMVTKSIEIVAHIDQYDDFVDFPSDNDVKFSHYLETLRGWGEDDAVHSRSK